MLSELIHISEEDILRKKCWQIVRGVPVNILEKFKKKVLQNSCGNHGKKSKKSLEELKRVLSKILPTDLLELSK